MSKTWIVVVFIGAVLALLAISGPSRLEHQYSPAFEKALNEAVNRLEGLGPMRTTAATPVARRAARGGGRKQGSPASRAPATGAEGSAVQETADVDTACFPTCYFQTCIYWFTCDNTCNCQTYSCPTEYYSTCYSETCDWETCDRVTCEWETCNWETCIWETCEQCGSPPVLDPVGDREVDADSQLVIQLSASDDDGDPLEFYTDADAILPSSFAFDSHIGLFVWTPSQSDAGVYAVTFGVTDGIFSVEETIEITVYYPHGNLPPVLAAIDDIYVYESETVVVTASATDPNGDPLLYSIDDARFTQQDSVFTWVTQEGDEGSYPVTVSVSDGFLCDAETLLVSVCQQLSTDGNHDPLVDNTSAFYQWCERNVSWHEENLGFVSGPDEGGNDWTAAIVSRRAFNPSDSAIMFVRFKRSALGNCMFGFTTTSPAETDFHYSNIGLGVYVHSSGYIRPTWNINNTQYWNTFLPEGFYDCKISVSPWADSVAFALAEVTGPCAPLSDFASPYWQADEQLGIDEAYFIQINAYNPQASVLDVWSAADSTFIATRLSGYDARFDGVNAVITWTLSAADERIAFDVLRVTPDGNESVRLSGDAVLRDGRTYRCTDSSCRPGASYVYQVFVEEEKVRRLLFETGILHVPDIRLTLYQNVPNPFNPSTLIRYALPRECRVHLGIYAISGALIARLVDARQEPGVHAVEWTGTSSDGSPVASGIYFCRLQAGKDVITRKMVLLR